MLPRHRTEYERRSCAELGRVGSTNSAVGDPAQDVLHLPRSQFGINCRDRSESAQRPVGTLEPAHSALMVTEVFISDGHTASQAVESVGFVKRKPSAATTPLQASRRKIECGSEFFEGQAGSPHQLLNNCRREPFPNRLTHIMVAG